MKVQIFADTKYYNYDNVKSCGMSNISDKLYQIVTKDNKIYLFSIYKIIKIEIDNAA